MKALLIFLSKSWFNKTLVGTPLILIFLAIILGFENAISLIGLSVVCTAGVGLAFWGGLGFIVGLILTTILKAVYPDLLIRPNHNAIVLTGDTEIDQIIKYIHDALEYGFTDIEIRNNLTNAGWNQEKIAKAYKSL